MGVLPTGAGTPHSGQTAVLAEIFRAAAEYVAAIRARDEIMTQALAEGVDAIRAALTRQTDEVASEIPGIDDEMDMLRQVAAIMNAR